MNNLKRLEQYKRDLIREHAQEIAAVDRLLSRERSKLNGSTVETPKVESSITTQVRHRGRMSDAALVREATSHIREGTDFTRREVEKWIAENDPQARIDARAIGVELWHLSDQSMITTVRPGRGRIPAVYRR